MSAIETTKYSLIIDRIGIERRVVRTKEYSLDYMMVTSAQACSHAFITLITWGWNNGKRSFMYLQDLSLRHPPILSTWTHSTTTTKPVSRAYLLMLWLQSKIYRRSSWICNQGTHCERPKGLSTIDFQWGLQRLPWTFNDSTNCWYVERGDGTICIRAIHGKNSLLEACKDRTEHARTWGSCPTYSRNHMWQEHTTNQKTVWNVRPQ